MVDWEKIANLYDWHEAFTRTPADDDKLELKMPDTYRKVFRKIRGLIRTLLVSTFILGVIILTVKLITGKWWALGSFFYFVLLPNFVLSIIKQLMRKYAKIKFA